MGTAAHALLSASSAHRWLHCTAAPKLEATFPDTTSEYAREGTLAHEICELKLTKYVTTMARGAYTKKLNVLKKHELYQPEMLETSEVYLDYIKGVALSYPTAPAIAVERRVNFSDYAPDGFGTADCLLLAGSVLHVIDYKHGKGVAVDAVNNPQMMLYALGAVHDYAMLYRFETVKMAIVQPRVDSISEFEIRMEDLLQWGETVIRPKAQEALSEAGQFAPGEHCRFCRARYVCKARSEHYATFAETARARADPRLLTLEELGAFLHDAKLLKKWAEDLEKYALAECLEGHAVPGWKAVAGRGSRAFKNADAAFEKLIENGIEESVLYERTPLSLAQAEKVIGKKIFGELVGDMVVKNPGAPTLAPESDKRPAVTIAAKAADVFEDLHGKDE